MRILLLSAYDTVSHKKWREQLVESLSEFEWTVLTLAPRYFNFRVRTNALSWLSSADVALKQHYDLIIATSLTDIVSLKAFLPNLQQTPIWLYCHENQFAYPESKQQDKKHLLEIKTCFLMNCIAANKISFNSSWNQSTALSGLANMLKQWPEKLSPCIVSDIKEKSDVLPVMLNNETIERNKTKTHTLSIVWNHRWEYDKGPDHLLALINKLDTLVNEFKKIAFSFSVLGQQFRQSPQAFDAITASLTTLENTYANFSCGPIGFIEDTVQYQLCLKNADVVLSTALHDFQGLSIQEAIQQGCTPLVPNQLVYPEIYPSDYCYTWHNNVDLCADSIIHKLQQWLCNGLPQRPSLIPFLKDSLAPAYKKQIVSLRH